MSRGRNPRDNQPHHAQSTPTSQAPTSGHGFINPYNFVRVAAFDPYCETPRTHEKFAGLSGRITVTLENVSPLCLPDSDASQEFLIQTGPNRNKKRWRKEFSRLNDGRPYIPASSIKGMLRSVAEAASNSCFPVFNSNMAVFRDNRSHIPTSIGVGRLVIQPNNNLGLLDPGVRPYPGMFSRRGLFNQINRPHSRAATTRPSPAGLNIHDSVKQIYLQMIKDDNFTLKENNVERGPRPTEKKWLRDFANATGQGDLWCYRCHATNPNLVVNIGRNFRYKWAYNPREALHSAFHPCDTPDSLCLCCGIFGMTEERENSSSINQGEVNSLAGKISVSPAFWARGTRQLFDIDDPKILGTPKYSCRSFYLHSDSGSFNVAQDEYIRVDSGNVVPNAVRGRKFYWHHTQFCNANWTEQDWQIYLNRRRKPNGSRPAETDQNAKIQALLPGAQFDFTIDFENLSSPQLGLLLWTIALPDISNSAHHLGLGKPNGMGSIVLRIRRIQLIDRKERYTSVFATGITTDVTVSSQDPNATVDLSQAPFDEYINAFRSQMEALSGGTTFADLPNIADLRIILCRDYPHQATLPSSIVGTSSISVPITYPPGQANAPTDVNDPHPEDLHYKWFGVKRWSERLLSIQEIALGQRQTLIPAYQQRR